MTSALGQSRHSDYGPITSGLPHKPTSSEPVGMSQTCQQTTSRLNVLFYLGHDRLIFGFDPDNNCHRCFVGGVSSEMVGVWWRINKRTSLHDLGADTLDLKGLLAL